ncbi:hypothetical protein GCM10028807_29310 [Spirosoma daeguense]
MIRTTTFFVKLVIFLFCLSAHVAYAQVVTTIASGTNIGDGQPALNSGLSGPTGIAFDHLGNSFIVDTDVNRVRKINASGIISTFSGNGELGSTGDNGPAISAQLFLPRGIATDATGRVYIADSQNHRIRRINTDGIITTVAGNGTAGFSGDGGQALNAQLNYPSEVTVDNNGNLYIVDSANNRVRKVDTNGVITTIAGTSTVGFSGDGGQASVAQLNGPSAVTVYNNAIYIVDSRNCRIRKIDINGIITTIAGNGNIQSSGDGGLAQNATLYFPTDIATSTTGVLYISQRDARIRKIDTNSIITTLVGNGTSGFSGDGNLAINALIGSGSGVDVDASGNIYISDKENYRVRRITNDGIINTIAGDFTGDGGPATNAFIRRNYLFSSPSNLTVDKLGNIYISDRFGNRIRKVSPAGIITTVVGTGIKGYTGDGGPASVARITHPRGVGLDSLGNLYVVDQYNTRLRKVDLNGNTTTTAGDGTPGFIENRPFPSSADIYNSNGMAVSKNGTVYVPTSSHILKITPEGIISTVTGTTAGPGYSGDGGLAINAQISNPSSVALDREDNLYIADRSNNRVRKIDSNGIITTIAGNGTLGYSGENVQAINSSLVSPYEVVVNHAGIIYISESEYSRIRRVDNNGMVTTILGGNIGELRNQNGITIDVAGNLYIADTGNQRIRKITYPILPTLTINRPANCAPTSLTISAQPAGEGFTYQFSPGATQIGNSNQAVVTTSGTYSVTVSTSIFGSPAGSASLSVMTGYAYTVKDGNWNDPTVWSCGAVPNATQNVQLLHPINLPQNYQAQAQRIKYESGSRLNVASGAKLNLTPAP